MKPNIRKSNNIFLWRMPRSSPSLTLMQSDTERNNKRQPNPTKSNEIQLNAIKPNQTQSNTIKENQIQPYVSTMDPFLPSSKN